MKKEKTKGGYIAQSVVSLIAAILIALLLFAAFSDDIKYLFGKAENMNEVLAEADKVMSETLQRMKHRTDHCCSS